MLNGKGNHKKASYHCTGTTPVGKLYRALDPHSFDDHFLRMVHGIPPIVFNAIRMDPKYVFLFISFNKTNSPIYI